MLATMFEGMWEPFFTVFVLLIVTFGSRIVRGLYRGKRWLIHLLCHSGERLLPVRTPGSKMG